MPQYYTITPTYTPLTLQEMLTIPTAVAAEYDATQKDIEEAENQLAVLNALADDSNQEFLDQYTNYRNKFSESFSKGYYDKTQAIGAKKLRDLYRANLGITQQAEAKQKAQQAAREYELTHPGARFSADWRGWKNMDFDKGNSPLMYQTDTQTIQNMGGAAGKAVMLDLTDRISKGKSPFAGYWSKIIENGLDPQQQQRYADLVMQYDQALQAGNPNAILGNAAVQNDALAQAILMNYTSSMADLHQNAYSQQDRAAITLDWVTGLLNNIGYKRTTSEIKIPGYGSASKGTGIGGNMAFSRIPARLHGEDLVKKIRRYKELGDKLAKNPKSAKSLTSKTEPVFVARVGTDFQARVDTGFKEQDPVFIDSNDFTEFKKLHKELAHVLNRQGSYETFGRPKLSTDKKGSPVSFSYDPDMVNALENVANIMQGYQSHVTGPAMRAMTSGIIATATYGGKDKKDNDYIKDKDGKGIKNETLNAKDKEYTASDYAMSQIFVEEGKVHWRIKGDEYIVNPSVLLPYDDQYGTYTSFGNLWDNEDYGNYDTMVQNYLNSIYLHANTKAMGQSETSTKAPFNTASGLEYLDDYLNERSDDADQ